MNENYRIKAEFLRKFLPYVQFPPKANAQSETHYVIGVLGNEASNPLVAELKLLKPIPGRSIEVREVDDLSKLEVFHLIFVSADEESRLKDVLNQTKNSAVLTVGETPGFLREGGIMNIFPVRNSYTFEINRDAAEKAGLKIDPKVISMAKKRKI